MENEIIPQPLDTVMTALGLTNADLVKASTEQLSFKMVQKGRKGRRLTPNTQEKILTALLKAKPELKIRRRDLFRYPLSEEAVAQITSAMSQIQRKEIKYPQFIDRLAQAGINHYAVKVATAQITFYGSAGEAHLIQGSVVSEAAPGTYNEAAIRTAISDAQKEIVDHRTFLKRIHDAGIVLYEVNLRDRKIVYKSDSQSYRENIPLVSDEPEKTIVKPVEKKTGNGIEKAKKTVKSGKAKTRKSTMVKNSVKARLTKKGLKRSRVVRRRRKSV